MNKEEEIIEMAIQAGFDPHDMSSDFTCNLENINAFAKLVAEKAFKEALAQPEQEPVADVLIDHEDEDGHAVIWLRDYALENGRHLLYTTPPQRTWVGLTDEERQDIALEVPIDAVFITEAKLKDKNTRGKE